jgi:hypothetical protein
MDQKLGGTEPTQLSSQNQKRKEKKKKKNVPHPHARAHIYVWPMGTHMYIYRLFIHLFIFKDKPRPYTDWVRLDFACGRDPETVCRFKCYT